IQTLHRYVVPISQFHFGDEGIDSAVKLAVDMVVCNSFDRHWNDHALCQRLSCLTSEHSENSVCTEEDKLLPQLFIWLLQFCADCFKGSSLSLVQVLLQLFSIFFKN